MLPRWFGLAVLLTWGKVTAQEMESYELEPVNYSRAQPHDGIAALQRRIAAGKVDFGRTDRDIVRALLAELSVPEESQVLVFSRTSLQRNRIRPDHPRSIFFSDNCYVGWVPSGLVEITAMDPVLGPVFYAFDLAAARTNAARSIQRDSDCLRCHGGTFVRGIPGVFARSVFTDAQGEPMLRHGSEVVDFRTPFTNRWGGWYVTGTHGSAVHRGNLIASEENGLLKADLQKGANITDLSKYFDTSEYLSTDSDIVALLVLEHQTAMQNALTRASIDARRMMEYQKNLQLTLKEPVSEVAVYDSVKGVIEGDARGVLDALLFRDEAQLPAGVMGQPAFQRAFLANARRASDGSSLRDFVLDGHIFKNRCSYMIYTRSFLELPAEIKRRVYDGLARALGPAEPDSRYAYLSTDERIRIWNILRETHPEFPGRRVNALVASRLPSASR